MTARRTAELADRVRALETEFAARQQRRRAAAEERMARLARPVPHRSPRRPAAPRPVDDDDEAVVVRDDPW